jgi:positive regulator of sigma E activity
MKWYNVLGYLIAISPLLAMLIFLLLKLSLVENIKVLGALIISGISIWLMTKE